MHNYWTSHLQSLSILESLNIYLDDLSKKKYPGPRSKVRLTKEASQHILPFGHHLAKLRECRRLLVGILGETVRSPISWTEQYGAIKLHPQPPADRLSAPGAVVNLIEIYLLAKNQHRRKGQSPVTGFSRSLATKWSMPYITHKKSIVWGSYLFDKSTFDPASIGPKESIT